MKYMLLIYHDEQSWSTITEAERQQIYTDYRKLREELLARGQFVTGSQLLPRSVLCQPACEIRDVVFYVREALGMTMNLVARWLGKKSRTTFGYVPVVIDKVVKARFRYGRAQTITVPIIAGLECNHQIEIAASRLTNTRRNHARAIFIVRHTDAAFMRMRREILNTAHQLVNRINSRDFLVVAIRARVIVGPTDHRVGLIVASAARLIRLLVLRVKEMRATNATERTQ